MPRIRNTAGDETLPICNNCNRSKRYCNHIKAIKFRFLDGQHVRPENGANKTSPLNDPDIASLFDHYIRHLANWYDLSDSTASFEKEVPLKALSHPLLFNAVIAFAAIHLSKTKAISSRPTAEKYHEKCVKYLIDLDEDEAAAENGVSLAAVCLLRSYEILGEDFDPNRHLSGAFALAMRRCDSLHQMSLARAGFFNFMREDITYSLLNRCPLKIDMEHIDIFAATNDEDQLNVATLHLGRVINQTFPTSASVIRKEAIRKEFESWMTTLPLQFSPYFELSYQGEAAQFPVLRMLRSCHVAVLQYSLVTLTLLEMARPTSQQQPHRLHEYAARISGLAFTSRSPAVIVNSMGPISFSCRYLRDEPLQVDLVRRLQATRKETGWPVHRIIDDLEQCWTDMKSRE